MIGNRNCKILIAGDFFLKKQASKTNFDNKELFNDFLPFIEESDLSIVNYEGPVDNGSLPLSKTGPVLRSSTESIELLATSGFNLLTLATNHIMDLGIDGLTNTISECKKNGLDYVGVGNNINEARLPFFCTINAHKIAILNFSENEFSTTNGHTPGANPLDLISNYQEIKKAKESANIVVVIVHGGHENFQLPSPRMKSTYRFFVDAGANAVIGHHTHCFSGYETYHGAPIVYSLGNLIFEWDGLKKDMWYHGYAIQLTCSPSSVRLNIIPYTQFKDRLGLKVLSGDKKDKFNSVLNSLNKIIEDDNQLKKKFDELCSIKRKSYSAYIEPHECRLLHALRNRGFFPGLLSVRKKRYLLNLIRCESHREVLIKILEDEVGHT